MFQPLRNIIKNVKKLNNNLVLTAVLSKKEYHRMIIRLNTEYQLYEKGIKSDGSMLPKYKPFTVRMKKMNRSGHDSRIDNMTLKDTGGFYQSFRVRNEDDGFVIVANAITDDGTDLTQRYGIEILGLSNNSQIELIQKLIPDLIIDVKKRITA